MTAPYVLAERIPDADLRRLALESSNEPVSVIIELAVPDPQVEYSKLNPHGDGVSVPVRVAPMSEQEHARLERTASDARKFLESLLAEPPVYLQSARAFVATVTGTELEQIAERSFTKRIERNRSLRN